MTHQNGRYSVPGPDNITRVHLDNGIVVLVYENFSAKSVVISGSVDAGSLYETPEKSGLASMTAASLMRGTQTRDFDAIGSALEDIGADLDISGRVHGVGFGGKALAEDLPVLMDLLADTLRYPIFPHDEVERLRGERLTWLHYAEQDTRFRATRAFNETLYPANHPYHHSTSGTQATMEAISIDEMRAFHQQHYGPQRMVITIVGAVKANHAAQIIRDRFGDWQNPDQPLPVVLAPLPPLDETHHIFTKVPGKTQVDIVMGTIGPSRFDKDYPSAYVANNVLGLFGMMGRIGKVIREDLGLAYYAYSRLEGGEGPGAWAVMAGVNPKNVQLTVQRTVDEIHRLTTELISEDDLADNLSYFTGRLPLRLESNEGIASHLHAIETYQLGLDYLTDYNRIIYGITRESVLDAARRYLNPDALVVSIAGPEMDS